MTPSKWVLANCHGSLAKYWGELGGGGELRAEDVKRKDEGCPIHRFMYHYFTDLDFRWTIQGGLKMLSIRVDSMESTRIVSLLSIRHAGSRFALDATPCESSRVVKCLIRIE